MFVFVEFNGGSAKAVAMTRVVLLACFVLFAVFLSLFPFFPSPAALCRYILPRLRVVSSVQQLSVLLQRVCCSSCSLSGLVRTPVGFFFVFVVVLIFLIFLVWLVLLGSRTRYASISHALP